MLHLVHFLLYSWGYSGHFAIGNLTMMLLDSDLQVLVTNLLLNDTSDTAFGRKYQGSLGRASTWPDYIKRFEEFQWSKKIHYFDTEDDPPNRCSLNDKIIKGDMDSAVTAVNFFFENLNNEVSIKNGPILKPVQNLKFFIHILQDLHQPLHLSGKLRGGNDLKVRFDSKSTNLHSLWDSIMINYRIKKDFKNHRQEWINYLFKKSKNMSSICFTSCQEINCEREVPNCIEAWNEFVNSLNCETVWIFDKENSDVQLKLSSDIGMEYYERNIELLENLIISAAIRSASLLSSKFKLP
eukprot:NODE_155_length_15238_cov_1.162560.p6 type:complete len:296 gc:universal NODE_155_length_15238_cov_1.162560:4506-5393(+)